MDNTATLPQTGFLRFSQVQQFIPVSKTAWFEGIKEGRYPKQVKLGKRMSAWKCEDIRQLIAELGGDV